MKPIKRWVQQHPFKAIGFTAVFAFIPGTAAALGVSDLPVIAILSFVGLLLWFTASRDIKGRSPKRGIKFMSLLLIGTVSFNSLHAEDSTELIGGLPFVPTLLPSELATPSGPDAIWAGVAVVAICGSYCVYKIVRLCQKKFPKDQNTNAPSGELNASSDEYGGAYNYGVTDYCWVGGGDGLVEADTNAPPFIAHIKVLIDEWGGVASTITASQDTDGSRSQDWSELQAEVASHGLTITGQPDGTKNFERGGVPCSPDAVPFTFDEITHAVVWRGTPGRIRHITIERSADMQQWGNILTVDSTFDTGFEAVDLSRQGQMFYRVKVMQP